MLEFDHFADEINNSVPMIWYMTFIVVEEYGLHTVDGWDWKADPTQGVQYYSCFVELNDETTIHEDIWGLWTEVMVYWDLVETIEEEERAAKWTEKN